MLLEMAHTVDELKKYKIPLTTTKGILYLEEFNQKLTLLVAYQQTFPSEWASSRIPLCQHSYPSVYSDREIEFLELVSKNFFEIDWLEDLKQCSERYVEIPIYSLNSDWRDQCIEDLGYAEQFLLSLLGEGYPQSEWLEYFGFTPDVLFDGYEIDWQQLEILCQSASPPLSFLYDVACIVDHSSGCVWIDITDETYDSSPWTKEALLYLAQEWLVAQKYLAKLKQFETWIEQSVAHRIDAVNLWNLAVRPFLLHNQTPSCPEST